MRGRVPEPRAEIYALGSAGTDRMQFEQGDGTFRPQNVRSTGADVTVPLTSTINFVGTVNPDFSNVEVDQQTIAPQEFQRQLTEYRPFFAQGASFVKANATSSFSSPTSPGILMFYSPRIGPFDRGAKLEGSFGLQSFGVLGFRGFDATTGNTFDDIAYGYKHALPDRSFRYFADGVIAHHSLAGDDVTTDVGADGRNAKTGFFWGTGETFEHGSWVPQTGVAHLTNNFVGMTKPNWQAVIGYNDVSPNFNPIDGLTFNSDIRGFQGYAQTSGSSRWAKNFLMSVAFDRWFDESGAVHEADLTINATATFKNGFSINGLGPSFGTLRSYDVFADNRTCSGPVAGRAFFTGFPCYRNGQDTRFNLFAGGRRLQGRHAPADRSLRLVRPVRRQRHAAVFAHDVAPARAALARARIRRHRRALAHDRIRWTRSGCAASRWAHRSAPSRTSRSRCARSTGSADSLPRPARTSRSPTIAASATATSCS